MDLGLDISEVHGWSVLGVAGEVDVATAPQLRSKLVELVSGGCTRLVVDLTEVDFIDSTGLGVLVGARKRMVEADGELGLVVTSDRIRRLFDLTGLATIFTLHDALPAATGS
jgi:anti-sigma B factor antagonist